MVFNCGAGAFKYSSVDKYSNFAENRYWVDEVITDFCLDRRDRRNHARENSTRSKGG